SKEEAYIQSLDEKTGASLKLTVLNPKGKIWTLVAGGGASVIYADTLVDLGYGKEMANYGEYSGNPTDEETYQYAKTVLDLMVRGGGKVLLIGGGIANFTDVAKTFNGIIQALEEVAPKLKENGVKIFVRRGGPNYEKGLELMRKLGQKSGLAVHVFGPETHMTKIVPMALKELKN
ncbi:MAG TPA: ATP citrate lyase citrate-binding domain-containing protein, partial [Candidatus Norongarragalinales archaeon]|nr:ATP citrate lyase citrate-binding domain-containing protein [Candidatus Norongarragalinales archaeon]